MNPGRTDILEHLLIFPISCFHTHTLTAFWSKRLARFLGSGCVVPGRRGSLCWGNYCVSFLYLQTGSLSLNTRKIKIIVHNPTAPIPKSLPSKTWSKISSSFSAFSQVTVPDFCGCALFHIYLSEWFFSLLCKDKQKRTQQYPTHSSADICFLLGGACCCFSCFFPLKCLVTSWSYS